MEKLLVICGPTSTGKTKIALELANKFNGELISADSRQIYTGMNIGTGKDFPETLKHEQSALRVGFKDHQYTLVPYVSNQTVLWMYDVVDPDDEFSVSHYVHLATEVIRDIHKRGKLPIVVGGTGLYIKALVEGIPTIDIPKNDAIRKELEGKSVHELQDTLKEQSPSEFSTMNNSDRHNPRRLIRKIEVAITKSKDQTFSEKSTMVSDKYASLTVGIRMEHKQLEEKVKLRVYERVTQGIIQEIQQLLNKGYAWNIPSMNTFGYKEWKDYFLEPSEQKKQTAINDWIKDEIDYAKKQMTWFKKQTNIEWFDGTNGDSKQKIIDRVGLWYT